MAKGNVDTGDRLVLQDIADDTGAGGVRPDGKLAHAIAVLVGRSVGAELFEQLPMVALQVNDTVLLHIDGEGGIVQVAIFLAEIIADHAIDYEAPVRVAWGREDFASGKIPPLVGRNDPARLQPFQSWRKICLKVGPGSRLTGDSFGAARSFHHALTQLIDLMKISPHSFEHDLAGDIHH